MATLTLRYEYPGASTSTDFAVRREIDGLWRSGGGAWSQSPSYSPLSSQPQADAMARHGGTTSVDDDGLYAIVYRQGGVDVATRFAVVVSGSDGVPDEPAERSSELADILLATRQRLIDRGLFLPTQVEIGLVDEGEPEPVEGGIFGRVCPLNTPAGPSFEGAGRYATDALVPFLVRVYARKANDRAWVSRRALTHDRGLLRTAHRAIAALQQFIPVDAAACPIVTEPVRFSAEERPVRYRSDSLWYRADLQFTTAHRLRFQDEGTC